VAGRVPRLDGAELGGVRAVYLWADAVYMNDGLESDKAAILVVVLYLSDGSNVIAYLGSDYRESEERWAGPPRDLKQRGLEDSRSAVGDGVPGLRSVLTGIFSKMREQ
jgi:transposase-like protein